MNKTIKLKVKKGIINVYATAYIEKQTKTVMLLQVECKTKKPVISSTGSSADIEHIWLEAGIRTFYTHPTKTNDTIIYMPKGWKIFCAEVSKYSLYITLTR